MATRKTATRGKVSAMFRGIKWSGAIFASTLLMALYRDNFTNDSNLELYVGVIGGMTVAIAIKYLFESK